MPPGCVNGYRSSPLRGTALAMVRVTLRALLATYLDSDAVDVVRPSNTFPKPTSFP